MIPARIALAVGLAAASTAGAHSELRSATWCSGGIIHYTGEFAFTQRQLDDEMLRNARRRCAPGVEPGVGTPPDIGSPTSTCGVFDPPYETAVMMARGACGGGDAPTGNASDDGTTVAFVSTPASFNDADHHDTFDFSQGIQGMCGICLMPQVSTVPDPGIAGPASSIGPTPGIVHNPPHD